MKILITFRQNVISRPVKISLFIFKLEVVMSLPVYSMNLFLQYCLELLMYARNRRTAHETSEIGSEILIFLQYLIKNYSSVC